MEVALRFGTRLPTERLRPRLDGGGVCIRYCCRSGGMVPGASGEQV